MAKTVFFGTPEIAVPALRALVRSTEVVGVVCQPDKPAGRGMSVRVPAVKESARELGLEVHQPVKVKTGNLDAWIRDRGADAAVVMAYGRILPRPVLDAPRLGCINLHASLLPRYRGAAPIQWAIIRGETETGISLMQMDDGMDTGPVFSRRRVPIDADDDADKLARKLSELAADSVRLDLPQVLSSQLRALPQDDAGATDAPPIQKSDTFIDWSLPARRIACFVRGLAPRPGARSTIIERVDAAAPGKQLRICRAVAVDGFDAAPGVVSTEDRRLLVSTSDGALEVFRAQLEGKKELDAADLVNGRAVRTGDVLGLSP